MDVDWKRGRRRGSRKFEKVTSDIGNLGVKPGGSRREGVRRKDAGEIGKRVDGGVTEKVIRVLEGKGVVFEESEGTREGGGDFAKCPISCIGTI